MEYLKGILALLSKSLDGTLKLVGILGIIWGFSAIFDIGRGEPMSFERVLWLYGGIALVAVFVLSFAFYTYKYFKSNPRVKIRSTEDRISELEQEIKSIKRDSIKVIKVEYESGKIETYTKTNKTTKDNQA